VLNLIELYFLIRESASVTDALTDWSQRVSQERKLKVVLMTIPQWIADHDDARNQEKSLRRLGDLIVRLVSEFDDRYRPRAKDRLRCRLGKVRFPPRMFSEDMLLRFYERFRRIQSSTPDCRLCEFIRGQEKLLARRGIDLCGPDQRQKYAGNDGYVKQAERLASALASSETTPKCRTCERLGDTIIATHLPANATLVTADRSFLAFAEILGRRVARLPSLAELKRQHDSRSPPTGGG
jgi:hypothetical protein